MVNHVDVLLERADQLAMIEGEIGKVLQTVLAMHRDGLINVQRHQEVIESAASEIYDAVLELPMIELEADIPSQPGSPPLSITPSVEAQCVDRALALIRCRRADVSKSWRITEETFECLVDVIQCDGDNIGLVISDEECVALLNDAGYIMKAPPAYIIDARKRQDEPDTESQI